MKLNLFIFFFFFVFQTFLKGFSFYSLILLILWFRYKHEYVSFYSNFLQNSPWNNKIPRKLHEKYIFQRSADLKFKSFSFSVYHDANPRSHWTMQTVKKLNLLGKTAADKSAGLKAWFPLWLSDEKLEFKYRLLPLSKPLQNFL